MKQNTFSIFLGDTKTMNLKAVYAENGDPLDLTSCTEIEVNLENEDGSFVTRKLSLGQVSITSPALLGKFSCPISGAISALLKVGALQTFDVIFTIGAEVFTVRYENALSVFSETAVV